MAKKILGLAGSLRKDSYNKAVLKTLAASSWEGVEIEIFDTLGSQRPQENIMTSQE